MQATLTRLEILTKNALRTGWVASENDPVNWPDVPGFNQTRDVIEIKTPHHHRPFFFSRKITAGNLIALIVELGNQHDDTFDQEYLSIVTSYFKLQEVPSPNDFDKPGQRAACELSYIVLETNDWECFESHPQSKQEIQNLCQHFSIDPAELDNPATRTEKVVRVLQRRFLEGLGSKLIGADLTEVIVCAFGNSGISYDGIARTIANSIRGSEGLAQAVARQLDLPPEIFQRSPNTR